MAKKDTTKTARLEEIANELEKINTRTELEGCSGLDDMMQAVIEHLLIAMFPYHFDDEQGRFEETEKRTYHLMNASYILNRALSHIFDGDEARATAATDEFLDSLVGILELIKTDVQAGYEGDPAAKSVDEVILTYPAFKGIAIYRLAHKLYEMQIPLVPRIMSEYAHRITGIDIHPGAKIGPYFFIDHGTGVVVGETCTIGEHCKLYQHVTLGAKSFDLNDDGTPVKGVKRHPDLGDRVVVYSGASILGGNTRIGDDCIVGGNVWLTHSLEAGEAIVNNPSGQEIRKVGSDLKGE